MMENAIKAIPIPILIKEKFCWDVIEIKKTATLVVKRLLARKITTKSKKMVKNKLIKSALVVRI
jgi:uncharacterized integral membrane protein